ncbi:MAG TPA: RDD family protein, partial [Chthoniobacteraceae bacterium]|nr:RDD family protein [Chthoniobacteraceae bacterium]
VLVVIVTTVASWLLMVWLVAISPDIWAGVIMISFLVLPIAYGVLLEWFWRGQTVGKRVFRLRVMDADGLRLQFHQVLMRNIVRFVDLLPGCYMVGGVACLISRKAQRLGDLAAGTIVVHHRKLPEPDLEQLLGTKFNSLRAHAHLCARLRQRTTPEEARIALQALVRRDEFEPAARVRLFSDLAAYFRSITEIPTELVESMPDEQFVRNVVDVLFRTNESRRPAAA